MRAKPPTATAAVIAAQSISPDISSDTEDADKTQAVAADARGALLRTNRLAQLDSAGGGSIGSAAGSATAAGGSLDAVSRTRIRTTTRTKTATATATATRTATTATAAATAASKSRSVSLASVSQTVSSATHHSLVQPLIATTSADVPSFASVPDADADAAADADSRPGQRAQAETSTTATATATIESEIEIKSKILQQNMSDQLTDLQTNYSHLAHAGTQPSTTATDTRVADADADADAAVPANDASSSSLLHSLHPIEKQLHAHGPYVRIYRPDKANRLNSMDSAQSAGSAGRTSSTSKSTSKSKSKLIPGLDVTFGRAGELASLDPSLSSTHSASPFAYPAVVRAPAASALARVTVVSHGVSGSDSSLPSSRPSSPSQLTQATLVRPTSSHTGPRYARSSTASRSNKSLLSHDSSRSSPILDHDLIPPELASMPLLPFLAMTNSLQLYLKLNILADGERIVAWITGSYLAQISPFIDSVALTSAPSTPSGGAAKRLFSMSGALRSLVQPGASVDKTLYPEPSPTMPAYLLLTSTSVYIFRPLFSLFNLKMPIRDEQTSYLDPSKLLEIVTKFAHSDIVRIDAGPSRQHICFRVRSLPSPSALSSFQTAAHSGSGSSLSSTPTGLPSAISSMMGKGSPTPRKSDKSVKLTSWVFISRSRAATTQIVDYVTANLHELRETPGVRGASTINQDIEASLRNMQSSVFLHSGPKEIGLLSYGRVWSPNDAPVPHRSNALYSLSDSEHDTAATEPITKVDFDFLRFYLLGCFMRYVRPVPEVLARAVKIEPVSIIGSADYIYITTERLDVWPPLVVPLEFSPSPSINACIDAVLPGIASSNKGFVADIVPQFENVLGVGRIKDILRVERWRTWRIDSALNLPGEPPVHDFRGLGKSLQNGFIGYFGADAKRTKVIDQHGTTSGWLWWVRIVFGERNPRDQIGSAASNNNTPRSSVPSMTPTSALKSVPVSTKLERVAYWWDLSFASKDAVDELFDAIRASTCVPIHRASQSQQAPDNSQTQDPSMMYQETQFDAYYQQTQEEQQGPIFILGDD